MGTRIDTKALALIVVLGGMSASLAGACGTSSSSGGTPTDAGNQDTGSNTATDSGPIPSPFGLDSRPSNATCTPPPRPPSTAPIAFTRVFANVVLNQPMVLAQIPGDGTRWFVAQRGTDAGGADIVSFPVAAPPATPTVVGHVGPLMHVADGEGGLLGLAFHPNFAANGKMFISYVRPGGVNGAQSVIAVMTSADNGATFGAPTDVLVFDQTDAGNHKGGCLQFGADKYLYASFGDGGQSDDFYKNGQNPNGFFAKILRIDIDNPSGGNAYGIPDGNPFKSGGGEPATFTRGHRNPFRFTFDRATGDLWVGDVGQNHYEEIDQDKVGGNYGWPCREGLHDYITPTVETPPSYMVDPTRCPSMTGLIDPIQELMHPTANTRAIIGGVLYRGSAVPGFVGSYVFGDEVQTKLYSMTFDPATAAATIVEIDGAPTANWVDFAQDQDGEVYAVGLNDGSIWEMGPAPSTEPSGTPFPDHLSKTGCVDPNDPTKAASGLIPYGVNVALWSDGAEKQRWMALPDNATITVNADGDFDFPNGTVLMKSFAVGGKLIETRLFMHHEDGVWAGYSYQWSDDQTDAVLLPSSLARDLGGQTWYYPSRSDCVRCHNQASDYSLGLEIGQLNGTFVYPETNRVSNQLATLDHIGMFSAPVGDPTTLVAFPDAFGTAPVDQRARAYVHENCSICHRPNGTGNGNMDLRFGTSFAGTNTCNVVPQRGDLGITGAQLLAPGQPSLSILSVRPHQLPGANRMPPLASQLVDTKGVGVIDDWITSVTTCP